MDSANLHLLLLPLLGGYIFYSKSHVTSFAAKRAEGQRLIYSSSVIGVLLLLATRGLTELLQFLAQDSALRLAASEWANFGLVISGFCAGAVIFAIGSSRDFPRVRGALPRAAQATGIVLMLASVMLCFWWFEPPLWHAVIMSLSALALVIGVLYTARWVTRTSGESYYVASARVALLPLCFTAAFAFSLLFGSHVSELWQHFSAIQYSGTALFAAGLGALLWMPVNVVFTARWAWRRAHERGHTSGIELLLYKAFTTHSAIQVTVKDGKVYEGFIRDMPSPKARMDGGCIDLLPTSSGYRTSTKRVVITTDYTRVISRLQRKTQKASDPESALLLALDSLLKVIPLSEVQVASMYDASYSRRDFTVRRRRRQRKSAPTQGTAVRISGKIGA
jgi:hypothetical protein